MSQVEHETEAGKLACRPLTRDYVLLAVLFLLAACYFYPYLVNHKLIVAAAHTDDDFYVYNTVINNMQHFKNDMFSYLVPCFVNGTLLNWGALLLVNSLGVPIQVVSLSLQMVMFFMLPLCYVHLLKDRLERIWLLYVFMAGLLSQYYSWNLSNHGMVDLPYRPHIAIPMLFLGALLIIRDKKVGYLLVSIGILFHVPMGIYATVAIAVWQMISSRRLFSVQSLYLFPLAASIALPTYLVLSQKYSAVPQSQVIDLYRFNMHFLPWQSPFRWEESLSTVTAFLLLLAVAYCYSSVLGTQYRLFLKATAVATILMSASHLAGLALQIPTLISLCGLRSFTFLAVVAIPLIIVSFAELIRNGDLLSKVLASFCAIVLIVGRPYGLFIVPSLVLMLYVYSGKHTANLHMRSLIRNAGWVVIVVWFAVWGLTGLPPGIVTGRLFAENAGTNFAAFILPLIMDAAPTISHFPYLVAGLGAMLVIVGMLGGNPRFGAGWILSVIVVVISGLFLVVSSWQTLQRTGSQGARDLYYAQVWSREHTGRDDMFIVYEGSWRAFSERPTFVPRALGYYMYLPDQRIKAFDDFVFRFYGIEGPYIYYNQRSLSMMEQYRYNGMGESDFVLMAKLVGAKYLVERKMLNLPVAYRNSTYTIYRLL